MGFADPAFPNPHPVEWVWILLVLSLKSTIILTAGALVSFAAKKASAKLRHILWCATFSTLLLMPFLADSLQPLYIPILPSSPYSDPASTEPATRAEDEQASEQSFHTLPDYARTQVEQTPAPELVDNDTSLTSGLSVVIVVWLAGAVLVLARFMIGVLMMLRLVDRSTELCDGSWSELKEGLIKKVQLRRPLRLMRSAQSVMPMTCLGSRPTVLLPNNVDRWPADRRYAVVLHELIHIKRRDLLTQILSQLVCAFYWFNPIVWWAARRMRIEQECACDEQVLKLGVAPSNYAGHLLDVARLFRASKFSVSTGTAMARPSHLEGRLRAILNASDGTRSAPLILASIFVMSLVLVLTAITRPINATGSEVKPVDSPPTEIHRIATEEDVASLGDSTGLSGNATVTRERNDLIVRQGALTMPANEPTSQSTSPQDPTPRPSQQIDDGYSVQDRDRLRSNGIGLAYIKEMNDSGYRALTVEQLIALFSNGIRASYVTGLRSVGYGGLSTADLLSLKTNGVTPDVIKWFAGVNHADFKATNYASLISNGVTPSYIRALNDAGYNSLSANKIVEMRLAGITSDFIRERRGNAGLSPNELIELKRREKH